MVEAGDLWRVAALSAMGADELAALLGGDAAHAAPWVAAASSCGIVTAQVRYGRMMLAGEGVVQDRGAAFRLFEEAAASGDTDALTMLGRCHENGWGTAQDFARAALCYAPAAEAGDAWAQYNLGHLYLDGTGVARDRAAAFGLYRRAAEQGHARAMSLVGRCLEQGWGVPADPDAARDYYRRSAEAGYFRGAYNYASLLAAEGAIAEACDWFARAIAISPKATRRLIRDTLAKHADPRVRALVEAAEPVMAAA